MANSSYFVYIIQSQKDNSFYIGATKDVQQRIIKHNNANTGYTATKKPWSIVYIEEFQSKRDALIRERFIKKQKSKQFIKKLIEEV